MKRGKPRKGKEASIVSSFRIEPQTKKDIIKIFGSVQKWVDKCLEVFNEVKNGKWNYYLFKMW